MRSQAVPRTGQRVEEAEGRGREPNTPLSPGEGTDPPAAAQPVNPRFRLIDDADYLRELRAFHAGEDADMRDEAEQARRERERYEGTPVSVPLLPRRGE